MLVNLNLWLFTHYQIIFRYGEIWLDKRTIMHHNPASYHQVVLHDTARGCWLHFEHPREIIETSRVEDVLDSLGYVKKAIAERGLYAAGLVAYEAAPAFDPALTVKRDEEFPLVWFGLYDKPRETEILTSCTKPSSIQKFRWFPSVTSHEYRDAFKRIKEYILCGDTYQVNYTHRLNASFSSDPWILFLELLNAQDPEFGAFVNTDNWVVCCVSPELFFQIDGDRITSRPMKGTAERGLTYEEDIKQGNLLHKSEKDRAENIMIVDMVRNDIGRIAETGSVNVTNLWEVERYPTLWQMVSTVRAKTEADFVKIFQAMFPPASITGAPKSRTMEIIAELESSPRRVYTGSIGFITPNRRAQFNVAIRTIVINKNNSKAEYGVGGGIVWDSDLSREMLECRTKAQVLKGYPRSFCLLESLLWTPKEGYRHLDRHLNRLEQSASYFRYTLEVELLKYDLKHNANHLPPKAHKVRILIAKDGNITIESEILKSTVAGLKKRVAIAQSPVNSSDPFLFHKTTNRKVYENAKKSRPGYHDVILFNENGEVTESTIANLVVEINGALFTPPVHCGLLPGTYRAWMLECGMSEEKSLTIEEVLISSRVFLINSVQGMYVVSVVHPGKTDKDGLLWQNKSLRE